MQTFGLKLNRKGSGTVTLSLEHFEERDRPIPLRTLETMFEKTAVAVMGIDPHCNIVIWNSAAEQLFGHKGSAVFSRHCYDITHGKDSRGNLFCYPNCNITRMFNNDTIPNDYLLRTHTGDGKELLLNVSTLSITTEDFPVCLHLFHDVRWIIESTQSPVELSIPAPTSLGSLTIREREILSLMMDSYDTHEIATLLHISYATVRNHAQNIIEKLGVHSRVEAVVVAIRNNLVERHLPK